MTPVAAGGSKAYSLLRTGVMRRERERLPRSALVRRISCHVAPAVGRAAGEPVWCPPQRREYRWVIIYSLPNHCRKPSHSAVADLELFSKKHCMDASSSVGNLDNPLRPRRRNHVGKSAHRPLPQTFQPWKRHDESAPRSALSVPLVFSNECPTYPSSISCCSYGMRHAQLGQPKNRPKGSAYLAAHIPAGAEHYWI